MTHTIYRGRQKAQLDAVMHQRWQDQVGASQELRQFQISSSETTMASKASPSGDRFEAVLGQVQQTLNHNHSTPKLLVFNQQYRSPAQYQIPTLNTYLITEIDHPEAERMPPGQKVEPVAYIEHS